jgi:hypothetical protein
MHDLVGTAEKRGDPNQAYWASLEELSAKAWRAR